MSSGDFGGSTDLFLRPSARAALALELMHLWGLAAILLLKPVPQISCLGIAIVVASWIYLRHHAAFGYGSKALVCLTRTRNGAWWVEDATGRCFQANRVVAKLLGRVLILRVHADDGDSRRRFLFGDELGPDEMLRLRGIVLGTDAAHDGQH